MACFWGDLCISWCGVVGDWFDRADVVLCSVVSSEERSGTRSCCGHTANRWVTAFCWCRRVRVARVCDAPVKLFGAGCSVCRVPCTVYRVPCVALVGMHPSGCFACPVLFCAHNSSCLLAHARVLGPNICCFVIGIQWFNKSKPSALSRWNFVGVVVPCCPKLHKWARASKQPVVRNAFCLLGVSRATAVRWWSEHDDLLARGWDRNRKQRGRSSLG